ncbi:hypothetical protein GCM10010193_32630 [Kitasatospora atroaurantiaca]|uniref:WD40 repeat protein n=1 Tax=Kitasatospora atroaurantiaca TaxID=285545 RepID=A0A561ERJ9_9ACTN|nr:PD40 domain-containing protein [Kitasatospora atroaurantiaca]TWE18245.1 WD40 repeat protein [Kitasatospora atroaurantiaca]
MRFRKALYAPTAAAALVLPLLAGCGGSTGPASPAAPATSAAQDSAGKPGASGDSAFRDRDLVISAGCTVPASSPAKVWVTGYEPSGWTKVASVEFTLPAQVVLSGRDGNELSALYSLCAGNLPDAESLGSTAASDDAFGPRVRRLFDRDFTRLAVVTSDARTGASHVGYVDRAGKFTDLTGDGGGFATPKERDALFAPDGDSVWFTYRDGADKQHIAGRSVGGNHQLTEQWTGARPYIDDLNLALGGSPLRGVIGSRVYFSPDGKRVAAFVDRQGQNTVPVTANGILPAGATATRIPDSNCKPSGWVDNHTILCAISPGGHLPQEYETNLWTLDVDRSPAKEEPGRLLLPVTDRKNLPVAISPDGKRLLFRSVQGKVEQPYVTELTPGAEPKQITGRDAATALGTGDVVLEWR